MLWLYFKESQNNYSFIIVYIEKLPKHTMPSANIARISMFTDNAKCS